MNKNVAVIGAGSMGIAMAVLLSKNGNNVKVWSPMSDEINMLKENREHLTRLPGVKIPDSVEFTTDIYIAAKNCDVVVLAVPSQTTRQNCKALSSIISKDTIVVTCSKGIEDDTCKLLSEIMHEELPHNNIAVLSGPSHAEEIARDVPTTVVAASEKNEVAQYLQDLFMTPNFRVYTNTDVIGVELGGALKNIIALCAGISDGLGYGDNTKAALMTRGITEISRLGVAMGGKADTFSGLTGVGDLIVTCTSMHSRNRRAGILIGQGKSVQQALEEVNMVVEGVATTKPAYELAKRLGVSMPITNEAYDVLYKGKDPRKAVGDLMTRDKKNEMQ
ncbi:NAD(P)H-dependent glycerol-3-phosphate dehydrogenase [Ruminiclostridium herbifermentans]|uniref:Glycerol-3-phosphate dehydrogenase [NAD(P)+] n=1 Tax=Ruminiclostridium herbifermentans TaxID=2488810 RepID=A0A4U7JL98_9FIRM|nr:NAD(P)H-dependent glycerol-3-phosphate dehydrogenase [Ruminiclostridium herbifermentans]QNU68323.1 NAD(P)H-dependent glycerol-3-phosphate dehydrogenase [Ruminiclostridium herbifermentans]